MHTDNELWKTHAIGQDETLDIQIGLLHLWIHRGQKEWHIAYETEEEKDEGHCSVTLSNAPFDPDRNWTRWMPGNSVESIHLRPQLPDRPIIVRPEMPMCLMPKQSVQFFVGIPIWVSVSFGAGQEQAIEIPSIVLSNSFFGPVTEGELCYAMRTTAKLNQQDMLPSVQRAVFPLEVRNISSGKLNFERLCLRPQYLNIYRGETRLWANKGRASYRGADNWSRIVYSSGAPEFDRAGLLLGKAREIMQRGTFMKTFDNIKHRMEIV